MQSSLRTPTFPWGPPYPILTLDPKVISPDIPLALIKALIMTPLENLAILKSCCDLFLES